MVVNPALFLHCDLDAGSQRIWVQVKHTQFVSVPTSDHEGVNRIV